MSATPGKGRVSGIPAPGKSSSIPTPGRPRSASSAAQHPAINDDEYISQAFADAIRANDPANHRTSFIDDVSLSASSANYAFQSGRKSVAGRPSSATSSSSAFSSGPSRNALSSAKPVAPRPSSRASDVFTRSSSRAGRTFDIGDNVRLESLGFEGVLRYLGDIDGKPGLYAGVELRGGFAGKGKNNGSVGGKQYFSCPSNCGVFIAANKLSPPTVGAGAISRPSSVASTRSGRETPLSGHSSANIRKTPSVSNGRVTPSFPNGRITPITNGRITPVTSGRMTPSTSGRRTPGTALPTARSRSATATQPLITPVRLPTATTSITPGSRASKYVGMTAKQLSTRTTGSSSPVRGSVSSPTRSFGVASSSFQGSHLASPSRTSTSPFTPRAARSQAIGVGVPAGTPTKTRTALNTPRARVPSAVAMPPPPSPSGPSLQSRSVSLNDPILKPQREYASLDGPGGSVDFKSGRVSSLDRTSRPSSSASSYPELQLQNERLQARLDALEDENRRLMTDASNAEGSLSSLSGRLDSLTREQDTAAARITDLEFSLRTAERTVGERDSTIESLERSVQQSVLDVEKVRSEGEARARDIQSKLDDKEALVIQLKEIVEAKEGLESENDAVLSVKNTEISLLESRVQKAYIELEEERRELGAQVDELRKAGQETIALYEERLSAADGRRYELEDLISSLEEQLRMQARPQSPASMARKASSAMEIDNEALREQVQHLHKKIASLEDALEEAHLTSEREEAAIHEKVAHYKEREESMRGELSDSEKEMERVMKSEESARLRIEEIEEALRENTVALENARAEIEGLRAEIANLESIAAGGPQKAPNRSAAQTTGAYELLKAEKSELEHICKQRDEQLAEEREASAVLRQALDERIAELDATRKKLNRELPVNGLQDPSKPSVPPSPSKHDLATAREEIKGLKHIVQELQMENTNLAQRYKVLESENKLLMSETEQLREDMKQLEDNIEQSLLREEEALQAEEDAAINGSSDNVSTLQKNLRDAKTKYEAELDQLRKRLSDLEMKHARTVHDLNKEIGELESLIESKIYREDELEREVERLKERSARSQKKSSKGLPEEIRAPTSVASSASKMSQYSDSTEHGGGEVCEICERPGHDIFTCDLLNDDRPLSIGSSSGLSDTKQDLYCEDCESRGHTAANCPHSLDVF